MWLGRSTTGLLAVFCLGFLISAAPRSDTTLEAKRKAGALAIRAGNLQEALVFLNEVSASSEATCHDQISLARVLEKLNRPRDAAETYRKVLEMTFETARDPDEKAARGEAERRLRVLDPLWDKVRQARDRFFKDLDALEREAEAARNDVAAEQLCRLRGAVLRAENNPSFAALLLPATANNYYPTGYKMYAGQTYRIRAAGTWRMNQGPEGESTADGNPKVRSSDGVFRQGQLLGVLNTTLPGLQLGADVEFVAPSTAILGLGHYESGPATDNSGLLRVYIERKP